jgi:hypothetical protein
MTDIDFVKRHYPTAHVYSAPNSHEPQAWKIYHLVGECYVALSASFDTPDAAWRDAAKKIRERNARV